MWLSAPSDVASGYVTVSHIDLLRNRSETSLGDNGYGRRLEVANGTTPTFTDDSECVIHCLYTNILVFMKVVDRNMCSEFFEMLNDLFVQ